MQSRLPETLKSSYGFEQLSQITPRTYHLPEDMELDGELYVHGKKLQEITSLAKRFRVPDSTVLTYQVYDVPMFQGDRTKPWAMRRKLLESVVTESPSVKRA